MLYSLFNVGWRDISSGASGVGVPDVNESNNGIIIIPAEYFTDFQSRWIWTGRKLTD